MMTEPHNDEVATAPGAMMLMTNDVLAPQFEAPRSKSLLGTPEKGSRVLSVAPIVEEREVDNDGDDEDETEAGEKASGSDAEEQQQGDASLCPGPDVPLQRSGVSDVMAAMSVMRRGRH